MTKPHPSLIIVRHGESEWNARGVWTGTTDVHLTAKGRHEAELMGQLLRDFSFDQAFISEQVRTAETLAGILKYSPTPHVPVTTTAALNERDYGIYTGKNKWEVKAEIGEAAFQDLRRGWDHPIPEGETMKAVYERSVPYYLAHIAPLVAAGRTVLIVAHGNSIRTLVKYIESIGDDDIADVEMIFGTALIYELDAAGRQRAKSVRAIETTLPPA